MPENRQAHDSPWPDWYDGKHLNEVLFCQKFLEQRPMKSVNGTFFTVNGRVSDENWLKKEIYDQRKTYVTSGLSKRVTNLLDVMRVEAYCPFLPIHRDRLHVANGTLFLDGRFVPDKDYCRNRLPVAYEPGTPSPVTWLRFLSQLLAAEDIPTLQEFMGYCFIPSTKGQKMLMLITIWSPATTSILAATSGQGASWELRCSRGPRIKNSGKNLPYMRTSVHSPYRCTHVHDFSIAGLYSFRQKRRRFSAINVRDAENRQHFPGL